MKCGDEVWGNIAGWMVYMAQKWKTESGLVTRDHRGQDILEQAEIESLQRTCRAALHKLTYCTAKAITGYFLTAFRGSIYKALHVPQRWNAIAWPEN